MSTVARKIRKKRGFGAIDNLPINEESAKRVCQIAKSIQQEQAVVPHFHDDVGKKFSFVRALCIGLGIDPVAKNANKIKVLDHKFNLQNKMNEDTDTDTEPPPALPDVEEENNLHAEMELLEPILNEQQNQQPINDFDDHQMPELDYIDLRVFGDCSNIIKFRQKRNQSLRKLKFEYSVLIDKFVISINFYHNDRLIMENDTPLSLQMNDNDIIYASLTEDQPQQEEVVFRFREPVANNLNDNVLIDEANIKTEVPIPEIFQDNVLIDGANIKTED